MAAEAGAPVGVPMTTGSVVAWIEGRAKELAARARRFGGEGVNGKLDALAMNAARALGELEAFAQKVDALDARVAQVVRETLGDAAADAGASRAAQGPPDLPSVWSAEPASPAAAAAQEVRRLTEKAREEVYRRVVASLAQGEEALRATHEALKLEFGPRAYRTFQSLIANAKRHTGKHGAAAGSVADASPQPRKHRKHVHS